MHGAPSEYAAPDAGGLAMSDPHPSGRAAGDAVPYEYDMRVAFVGAGLMGRWMVARLVAAGHDVTVFARDPRRVTGVDAPVVDDLAQAVAGREAVCLCVTDSADSAQVVDDVLAVGDHPGLVVDLSTIAPAVARRIAARCAKAGVAYVDCPVSGGPAGAEAGTLAIMCGGDAEALDRAAPLLDAIGDPARRTHCGPVGAGLVVKLVNNLLVGVISSATAEALALGQRAGIDPGLVRDVLMGATANSWQLENLFPRVLQGDHRPGFTAANLCKDLGHALGLDDAPMPFGELAMAQMLTVDPAQDYGAVARLTMDLPPPA